MPRSIQFWANRGEIYVTHDTGLLSVYDSGKLEAGPVCK